MWRSRDASRPPMIAVLEREASGDASPTVEASLEVSAETSRLVAHVDTPAERSRYRWSLRDADGVEAAASAWSAWLDSEAPVMVPLPLVESA